MSTLRRSAALLALLFLAGAASADTFTVTNTNDSGPGSLRAAIVSAQSTPSADVIEFAIGSGLKTIRPLTQLPSIASTVIDGRTQPGFAGKPIIEIDCSLSIQSSYCVQAEGSTLRSLIVNRYASTGVRLGNGSYLYGSWIGLDATGTFDFGSENGIGVTTQGSVVVGGPGENEGNVISGNEYGISASSGPLVVAGNLVGTDWTGTKRVANDFYGIIVSEGYPGNQPVTIGGSTPAHGNVVIGQNWGYGIQSDVSGIVIRHNSIGTSSNVRLGGHQLGISLHGVSDGQVVQNTITGCNAAVLVTGVGLGNQIRGNSIYGNNYGIDLTANQNFFRQTPNDFMDADTGPNNYQNYPILSSVQSIGDSTRVVGSLSSHPNETFSIDIYANDVNCGQGETFIGSFEVTTDGTGVAAFDRTWPAGVGSGYFVTATATSELEGTSEFSPECRAVEGAGVITIPGFGYHATEGSNAVLQLHRNSGSVGVVTVQYWTTPQTAGPADFQHASGTVTFEAGETVQIVTIPTTDDTVYEGSETFQVSIGNPTGGARVGQQNTATVRINDNDPAPFVQFNNIQVKEGDDGLTNGVFTATLSQAMTSPASITYYTSSWSASASSDFHHTFGSLTFQPGETVKTISVAIVGDTLYEGDEEFQLYGYGSVYVASGRCTIVNDDEPTRATLEDITVTEADGNKLVTLTFTTNGPVWGGWVSYALTPGTAKPTQDYFHRSGTVFFYGNTSASVTFTLIGDDDPEPNEELYVQMIGSYNLPVARSRATITILNDDTGVGPAQQRIAVGETATFVIELGEPLAADAVIHLTATGSGISIPSSVDMRAGESRASFDARGTVVGSAAIEVVLPPAVGGVTHTVTTSTYIERRIVFTPNELTLYVGQILPVTASLSPASNEAVTVTLDSKTDAIELPSTIVIPAGGSVTFDVKAVKEGPAVVDSSVNAYDASGLFGHVSQTPTTPAILRIAPPTGPTAGGTTLEVTGVNFRTDCRVTFDGIPADVRFVSATHLAVTTPPHDEATVDVQLSCGTDQWFFSNGFTYVGASPSISGVVPAFGNIAGGTQVRISGENFRSSCWPSFGGTAAPRAIVEGPTSIAATVPAHAAGTVDVSLRCTGSDALRAAAFHYNTTAEPQATIEGILPLAGSPGQPVTITGLRFRASDRIDFDGVTVPILSTRSGEHVVRVPELPAGRVAVTLTDANGNVTTTGPIFTVLEAIPPFITAVSPSTLPAGAEVRLDGRGFRPGYLFRVGDKIATVASLQYTTLVLRLDPTTPPGEHDIEIYNSSGRLAGIGPRIRVTASGIALHSVDIPCATTDGGVLATLGGTGFAEGAIVRFNSVVSTEVTVVSDSAIRAVVPPGEAGPSVVSVTNPDGTHGRLTGKFKLVSPFDPNGGCTSSGRSRSVRH